MDSELNYRLAVNATKSLGYSMLITHRLSRGVRLLVGLCAHAGLGPVAIAKKLGTDHQRIAHAIKAHRLNLIKHESYKADFDVILERFNTLQDKINAEIAEWETLPGM